MVTMVLSRHENDSVQARTFNVYSSVAKEIECCSQHCAEEETFCRIAEIAEHRTDKHVDEEEMRYQCITGSCPYIDGGRIVVRSVKFPEPGNLMKGSML